MSYLEKDLILSAEWIRWKILDLVKYFWWIDSILPMLPAIFDAI